MSFNFGFDNDDIETTPDSTNDFVEAGSWKPKEPFFEPPEPRLHNLKDLVRDLVFTISPPEIRLILCA